MSAPRDSAPGIWICQCLCPDRHCIVAVAGEADDAAEAEVCIAVPCREAIADLLARRVFNPWCGLCHAPRAQWQFETRRTVFATLAEAVPLLAQLQANMAVTAAVWGDMKRSD